jgi:hypothetical protein
VSLLMVVGPEVSKNLEVSESLEVSA